MSEGYRQMGLPVFIVDELRARGVEPYPVPQWMRNRRPPRWVAACARYVLARSVDVMERLVGTYDDEIAPLLDGWLDPEDPLRSPDQGGENDG